MLNKRIVVGCLILLVPLACGRGGVGVEPPVQVPPGGGNGAGFAAEVDITIEHPDAETIEYQIRCDGEGSTVVGEVGIDAAQACDRLSDPLVQDRLIDGPPPGLACTEIYGGPDTATIEGAIAGVDFTATIDRVNGCGIGDWDVLLRGVLPPALGVAG